MAGFYIPLPADHVGTGDVVGPGSSTDNAVARFDGTTGKLIQNSVVTISDAGVISGATFASGFTQGSVVFAGASGVLSQNNASFFWDDSNARLGLGTVSPAAILHVDRTGANDLVGVRAGRSDTSRYIDLIPSVGGTYSSVRASADLGLEALGASNAFIYTNSSERMRIDSTGLVGIGTNSPGAQLQVTATASTNIGAIVRGAASQSANLQQWQNSSGTALSYIDSSGSFFIRNLVNTGSPFSISSAAASEPNIIFKVGSTTAFSLRSNAVLQLGPGGMRTDGGIFQFNETNGFFRGNFSLFFSDSSEGATKLTSGHTAEAAGRAATNIDTFSTIATSNLLAVSNAGTKKAVFSKDGKLGIGNTQPSAMIDVVNLSASTTGQILKAAASQTANLTEWQNSSAVAYAFVGPSSLSGSSATSNFFRVVGSLNSSNSASALGVTFDITSAGSSAFAQRAVDVTLAAGYTGASATAALNLANAAAGTAGSVINADGNAGSAGSSSATTTGYNFGHLGIASGGNVSVGVYGRTTTAKNSATNIGVCGFSRNTGTSPVQVGGYFGLHSADPTFVSAALMADNGAETSDIFVARDNGTERFVIEDGGTVDISGIAAGTANFRVTATSDTPTDTWGAVTETFKVSAAPSGYLEISVGGNPRYIPFWT